MSSSSVPSPAAYSVEVMDSMSLIDRDQWDALNPSRHPFIAYDFLLALEESESVCGAKGVHPLHLCVFAPGEDGEEREQLIAACPMYLKEHSYGEYIFDWQIAEAAYQNGIQYYPKLMVGVPYTPVTGERFLVREASLKPELIPLMLNAIRDVMEQNQLSSAHILFCNQEEFELGRLAVPFVGGRYTSQYHWLKKQECDYAGFLDRCRSRHRKQIRNERKLCDDVTVEIYDDISKLVSDDYAYLYRCYQHTHEHYGNPQYLTEAFFLESLPTLGSILLPSIALMGDTRVASTVNFKDDVAIYGRYWGSTHELKNLHFEMCYHQLIEHALQTGRTRVEAGAGGGHKIKRGFEPVYTYSLHMYRDGGFHRAVSEYYEREKKYVDAHIEQTRKETPYK